MKNGICTKGFINELGDIEVPGVFFEEGAEVDLKIWVERGRFETAASQRRRYSVPVQCLMTAAIVR